ncbi:MAG TPA: hemerythrin domain-containing protein [Frankiaceae bacterium]|jgi:hypothetical protein|nr:hemerythrin domain-containing protein [Frankiaceae bacterium]
MYAAAPTTHGLTIPAELLDEPIHEPDLKLFLLAHRAFRREFGRLAVAASSAPVYGPRADAIEAQIGTVVRSLAHHHRGEDARIWPLLRRRDPAAAVALDALESEHAQIDPLIAAVSDMFDHMNEQEIAGAMAAAPKIMTWMYMASWRRTYAKRRQLAYGY